MYKRQAESRASFEFVEQFLERAAVDHSGQDVAAGLIAGAIETGAEGDHLLAELIRHGQAVALRFIGQAGEFDGLVAHQDAQQRHIVGRTSDFQTRGDAAHGRLLLRAGVEDHLDGGIERVEHIAQIARRTTVLA